jgi:membrane protein YdbS with pleckstrin-like domain
MNVAKIVKLKDDERVLRVVRNHWIVYLPGWAGGFLLMATAFFLMMPLFTSGTGGVVAFALLNAIGLLVAVRTLVVWHWNAFVVTSHRVVDVDQRGFFSRTVSEATYDKVQDVSYAIKGVLGTLLRYGTVELQTAGTSVNLELPHVHDPKDVHHLITESMSALRERSNGGARNEKIAALLEAAAELNDSEARAFVVALQEAVASGHKDVEHAAIDEKDLEWLRRDVKEEEA